MLVRRDQTPWRRLPPPAAGMGRAADLMASSEAACRAAHKIQTALIGQDEGCGKITVNLILVHAGIT